ncbi:MAG: HAD hydrolase family protein [Arcobacteraceae bacterium]|jgi:3-deoxy-D-manno-octulosonate 8-phosphate phosphatase (KDO 8-P phosphatase)|nr:HAD hydrolase family protein [Arcobacteraceae bacterium]
MIKLLVFDVDGTLTNGKITYDANGVETKSFDVKDGMAIESWVKKFGFKAAFITGRNSVIVDKRGRELGVEYIYQGVKDKTLVLDEILKKENLTLANVAAIGDDLNDIKMLQSVKLSFCPSDAANEVKDMVSIVSSKSGGNGAAREMIEYILKMYDLELKSLWL